MNKRIENALNAFCGAYDHRGAVDRIEATPATRCAIWRQHGNEIAHIGLTNGRRYLYVTNAGYATVTTKARLNAILHRFGTGMRIVQRDFSWFVESKEGTKPFTGSIVVNI